MTLHERMSGIRSVSRFEREAGPAVRRLLGIPLRHQPRGILGRPDYANKRLKVACFVDGDFWHGGPGYREPGTNAAFWREKMGRNRARRAEVRRGLKRAGWAVYELWESDLKRLMRGAGKGGD